jgi:hypothetical protein
VAISVQALRAIENMGKGKDSHKPLRVAKRRRRVKIGHTWNNTVTCSRADVASRWQGLKIRPCSKVWIKSHMAYVKV